MPKRIIDGEAVWGSQKLHSIEQEWIRGEYANLLPLALANGVFELDVDTIWLRVYGYLRPHITRENLHEIITAFERVGVLFRFISNGKTWGYWVGIDKLGRLPATSKSEHMEKGPPVPQKELRQYIESLNRVPEGYPKGTLWVPRIGREGLGEDRIGKVTTKSKEPQSKERSSASTEDSMIFTGVHLKVTGRQDQTLAAAYPWIDRPAEYTKLDAWLEANPRRRPKGYPAFLQRCFARIEPPGMAQGRKNGKLTGQALFEHNLKVAGFQKPRAIDS